MAKITETPPPIRTDKKTDTTVYRTNRADPGTVNKSNTNQNKVMILTEFLKKPKK